MRSARIVVLKTSNAAPACLCQSHEQRFDGGRGERGRAEIHILVWDGRDAHLHSPVGRQQVSSPHATKGTFVTYGP